MSNKTTASAPLDISIDQNSLGLDTLPSDNLKSEKAMDSKHAPERPAKEPITLDHTFDGLSNIIADSDSDDENSGLHTPPMSMKEPSLPSPQIHYSATTNATRSQKAPLSIDDALMLDGPKEPSHNRSEAHQQQQQQQTHPGYPGPESSDARSQAPPRTTSKLQSRKQAPSSSSSWLPSFSLTGTSSSSQIPASRRVEHQREPEYYSAREVAIFHSKNQAQIAHITAQRDGWHAACQSSRRDYENLTSRYTSLQSDLNGTIHKLRAEVEQWEKRYEQLMASHAESVIGMGTGIEPISDDTFAKRVEALQTSVRELCRRPSMGREVEWGAEVLRTPAWRRRVQKGWTKFEKDECWFKPNHIMQAVTWMYLEEKVFAEWYPGVEDAGTKEGFGKLEEMVRGGDRTPGFEKAEYWRGLTCSLIYQNPATVERITAAIPEHAEKLTSIYISLFPSPPNASPITTKLSQDKLREVLSTAFELTTQMRCQRGDYVLDIWTRPGMLYEGARMCESTQKEGVVELEGKATVALVVSRRWLRLLSKGSKEAHGALGRGLVLVRMPEEEEEEEGEGDGEYDGKDEDGK